MSAVAEQLPLAPSHEPERPPERRPPVPWAGERDRAGYLAALADWRPYRPDLDSRNDHHDHTDWNPR